MRRSPDRSLVEITSLTTAFVLVVLAACSKNAPPQDPLGLTLADDPGVESVNDCKSGGAVKLTPGGPGTDGTWYVGTAGNDVIRGTQGPDKIDGAGGEDVICGWDGADSLKGGAGDDELYGQNGDDWMAGEGDEDQMDGGKGNDVLEGGAGDDQMNGAAGGDTVHGDAGDDVVQGGPGNDDLFGEEGDDLLRGQQGVDDLDGGDDVDNCLPGGQVGDTRTSCELFLVQITGGFDHTCGLDQTGKAWCWGGDGSGQLGDGTGGAGSATPVAVTGGHTFASLAAGQYYTCGVRTDGAAYCWGGDINGQLGDGTTGGYTATPGLVVGSHIFETIAAGLDHTCGVLTDGAAYCWGNDDFGASGDGTQGSPNQNPSPVAVTGGHTFEGIAVHRNVSCADRTDGEAYCWGYDGYGAMGDGTVDSPQPNPTPVLVTGSHKFDQLAVGSDGNSTNHACGLQNDGAGPLVDGWVYCWGNDDYGQLGNGTAGPGANPTPIAVTGGHVFESITANQYFTCGVRTDDAAYCWGDNGWGQLGIGFYSGAINPTPLAVTGGHTWASLAAGFLHTCGVRTDGAAFCWGRDVEGQLGDGSADGGTTTPQPVVAP